MKNNIQDEAIANFNKAAHLTIVIEEAPQTNDDGVLTLKYANRAYSLPFLYLPSLTFAKTLDLERDLVGKKELLILTDYLPKKLKAYLRSKNISYLDHAGNAFITNDEGLFVYTETNTAKRPKPSSNRAFSKSGLKVLFQILVDEKVVNMPYREIGKRASVSIDTVGKVLKELLRDQYLIRVNENEYLLQHKERLLQEWVTIFNRVLRPKLKQQSFDLRMETLRELANKAQSQSVSGELGGELLSNYLIAEHAIIYTSASFVEVAKTLNLLPSRNGKVKMVEQFWHQKPKESDEVTVHPILVYADLLSNPTARNLETAKIVYNKYVKDHL
ncbi:MAG: type IV toxin-antitoxin system AbiEi family antitoxin [Bacteroidota bacterium]